MILRFQISQENNSWRWFDKIDNLQHCKIVGLPDKIIVGPDFETVIIRNQAVDTEHMTEQYLLVTFFTPDKTWEVYTQLNTFLMSDSGETIERLN